MHGGTAARHENYLLLKLGKRLRCERQCDSDNTSRANDETLSQPESHRPSGVKNETVSQIELYRLLGYITMPVSVKDTTSP